MGKLKKKIDHLLHPDMPEESEMEEVQGEESQEVRVVPQSKKAHKADREKDYAQHPKFAKFFKGES